MDGSWVASCPNRNCLNPPLKLVEDDGADTPHLVVLDIPNLNSNVNFTPLSPHFKPNFHLGHPNLFSPFDPKNSSDVMILESCLPGLINCSRLKEKASATKPKHLNHSSPKFSTKVFFNSSSKPSNPRTYKTLKNMGSLTFLTLSTLTTPAHAPPILTIWSTMAINESFWPTHPPPPLRLHSQPTHPIPHTPPLPPSLMEMSNPL